VKEQPNTADASQARDRALANPIRTAIGVASAQNYTHVARDAEHALSALLARIEELKRELEQTREALRREGLGP